MFKKSRKEFPNGSFLFSMFMFTLLVGTCLFSLVVIILLLVNYRLINLINQIFSGFGRTVLYLATLGGSYCLGRILWTFFEKSLKDYPDPDKALADFEKMNELQSYTTTLVLLILGAPFSFDYINKAFHNSNNIKFIYLILGVFPIFLVALQIINTQRENQSKNQVDKRNNRIEKNNEITLKYAICLYINLDKKLNYMEKTNKGLNEQIKILNSKYNDLESRFNKQNSQNKKDYH